MSTSTTQRALARFTKACARQARIAELLGERRMAALLRQGVSDAISETRAAHPAPAPIDLETAQRRARGRAFAAVLSQVLGRPPQPN